MLSSAPQVIFLDAMGTLFSLEKSVGDIYAQKAAPYGIQVEATALEHQFYQVFKRHHAPVFDAASSPASLAGAEKAWWRTVVFQTFQSVLSPLDLPTFDLFFEDIFGYFASAQPWRLFPEVRTTLQHWSEAGIELGIISNFDSRLFQVVEELQIHSFFRSITISSQAGAAKPNAQIFEVALAKHQCVPELALHIGDQWLDDCQGASLAHLQSVWLDRNHASNEANQISALNQITWPSL